MKSPHKNMIPSHYKLREQPFGMTPDPRYLYASESHRETLSSLLYGIWSGAGFVAITAMPGMGKTTILFEALRRLGETAQSVFLSQTITEPIELLRAILIDLNVSDVHGSQVELQAKLNELLRDYSASGKRLVVIIDEAQNLSNASLEAIRMLSNFETTRDKLLQIVLSGQLELAQKLSSPGLLQLRQRVTVLACIKPLSIVDTRAYIQHRLKVAGQDPDGEGLFTPAALALIARESGGVPRNINNLCFNALSLGCALSTHIVNENIVRDVISDLDFETKVRQVSQPQVTKKEDSPTTALKEHSKSPLILKYAISAIIAVAVLSPWAFLAAHRYRDTDRAIRSQQVASVNRPPSASPSTGATPSSQVMRARNSVVEVKDGESLYKICTKNLAKCDERVMSKIIESNPSILDPNHIESGERISLPNIDVNTGKDSVEFPTGDSAFKEKHTQ